MEKEVQEVRLFKKNKVRKFFFVIYIQPCYNFPMGKIKEAKAAYTNVSKVFSGPKIKDIKQSSLLISNVYKSLYS